MAPPAGSSARTRGVRCGRRERASALRFVVPRLLSWTLLASLLAARCAADADGCFGVRRARCESRCVWAPLTRFALLRAQNCSHVGRCTANACVCPPGRSGVDCAVGPAPPGGGCAASLWGVCVQASRPRIFIHELPRNLSWHGHLDFGRETSVAFLDRLLASEYRTASWHDADYFFVPAVDHASVTSRVEALDYVRTHAPEAWARAGGADHLYIGTNDFGADAYFPDRAAHPEQMRAIFLSHMGLWLGSKRGDVRGSFIPGQDIVIPSNQPQMGGVLFSSPYLNAGAAANATAAERAEAADAGAPASRPQLFFFAGSVPHFFTEHNVRWAVENASAGHGDMHVVAGSTPQFHAEMTSSRFCLGAPGQGGGWGRRATTSALHGCVPVFIQDNTSATLDELLPWRQFSLRFAESQTTHLHALLKQAEREPSRLASLQRHLACVWPRFVYSTVNGGAAQEDGSDDAFESVMTVLRRRLARQPGAWPAPGDVDASRGADPASRAARVAAEAQLADVCADSSVAGTGGTHPPKGGDVPPRLPCRHWGHPLGLTCDLPPSTEALGDPAAPHGGAVCVGVASPPCFWPRRANSSNASNVTAAPVVGR